MQEARSPDSEMISFHYKSFPPEMIGNPGYKTYLSMHQTTFIFIPYQ
jgi:hypothetical protein